MSDEKISEAKGKTTVGDNTTEKDRPTAQINPQTTGGLGVEEQDIGDRCVTDAESPSDLPECLIPDPHRGKSRSVWERVKQMIARITSPLSGWM